MSYSWEPPGTTRDDLGRNAFRATGAPQFRANAPDLSSARLSFNHASITGKVAMNADILGGLRGGRRLRVRVSEVARKLSGKIELRTGCNGYGGS